MEIGKVFTVEARVEEQDTARAVGSGELEVLATPKMCALMEEAAYKCVADSLDEGCSSVGTMLEIKHLSATPVGMNIRAVATLIAAEDRKITFELKAYDEAGLIGEGRHERFIIKADKFVAKTYAKLK